jgi:hypothetical protein
MKSKILMADLLVLRCRIITNAERAILFQRQLKESLCFTGCGCTTHELVTLPRLACAKVGKSLIYWRRPADQSRRFADSPREAHGWGNVLRIYVTEAADPAHRGHALLAADEAAIVGGIANIINRAPRIVLRLRACADPGGHGENCQ